LALTWPCGGKSERTFKEGDSVTANMPLAILDAMKMENEILSPKDGIVLRISVERNQILSKGDLILEIG
jgi:biotin carboxyl carrier protein